MQVTNKNGTNFDEQSGCNHPPSARTPTAEEGTRNTSLIVKSIPKPEGRANKIFRGCERIINDCETLHNATGATIKAFIWRTNDLRATKVYESPNFKGYTPFDFEENDKQPIFTPYWPHIQDKSRRRVPSTDKEFQFISSEKIEERPMPNL